MWRPWKQVCASSHSTSLQFVEQRIEPLVAHEAFHALVVDQQHRRVAAGAEALALLQRELAVGRGLAEVDAEPLLQMLGRPVRARQRARQVGADRQLAAAGGCRLYML